MTGIHQTLKRKDAGGGIYSYAYFASVYDDDFSGKAEVIVTFNTDGSLSASASVGDGGALSTDVLDWHTSVTAGIGSSRWAKKTYISGDATSGTIGATITALSPAKTVSIESIGTDLTGVALIEIYSDSGGTTKVGEVELTLIATQFP